MNEDKPINFGFQPLQANKTKQKILQQRYLIWQVIIFIACWNLNFKPFLSKSACPRVDLLPAINLMVKQQRFSFFTCSLDPSWPQCSSTKEKKNNLKSEEEKELHSFLDSCISAKDICNYNVLGWGSFCKYWLSKACGQRLVVSKLQKRSNQLEF